MSTPRFDLDHWMHECEDREIKYDLAGSTGPPWTVPDLLALDGLDPGRSLEGASLGYSSVEGTGELRAAIAEASGVGPADVQVTTGASEALAILVAAHRREGGNVVVPDPGYPPFAALSHIFGMEVRRYPLVEARGWAIDGAAARRVVDGDTALVIVNSPHNPTGACATPGELDGLERLAAEVGAVLVVDQVFHPVYHTAHPPEPLASRRVVVVGDTSKALALPGLRVGWIVDVDPERRRPYFDLRAYFTLSGVPLAERLAALAVRHRETILERTRDVATRNRRVLTDFVARHEDRLAWATPQGGLTSFPRLRDGGDARAWCRAVADEGVLLAPGDCFGHPAHFRLGFGATEPGAFLKGLEMLGGVLERR